MECSYEGELPYTGGKLIPITVQAYTTLLSIKTGWTAEDCWYCPQAARYHTNLEGNDLWSVPQGLAQGLLG